MRVLFVHHGTRLGGAPRALALLVEGLAESGVEAAVFLPAGDVSDHLRERGVSVVTGPISQFSHGGVTGYFGMRWGIPAVRELPRLAPHLYSLDRALRLVRPDLVHLNEAWLEPAARLARARGVPLVRHLRATLHPRGPARRRLMRRSVARDDAAIVINDSVAATWGPLPNAVQILDPVDRRLFHPGRDDGLRDEIAPGFDGFLVGTVSQIYPEKGVFDLLSALALTEPGLRVGVVYVGSPPRARADHVADLRRAAAAAGIGDRVFFSGHRDDPHRVYRALDAVVFAAHAEGPGMPAIEGAASGRPVIAASPTGASEVVRDSVTGLLVPARDPHALAAAIGRLAGDRDLAARLGAEAARRAARFDHRHHAAAVLDVYRGVLGA